MSLPRLCLGASLALALALVAAVVPPDVNASAAQATLPFTPVPCEDKAWTKRDPTIEPLNGSRVFTGEYAGGLYRMEIPASWNGELVLWAHGFIGGEGEDGLALRVVDTPLRDHLIARGFAWAASSYRCNGYVPGQGLVDTLALKDLFVKANGGRAPKRTYLMGGSMGGHAALLAAHALPTAVDGTLAFCPSGPELMDFFSAVGAAAEVITGITVTRDSFQDAMKSMAGALGTPPSYTAKGKQLASVQIQISGGPRPFAVEGLEKQFAGNVGIGADALVNTTTPWHRMATNNQIRYRIDEQLGLSADVLNARARRKPAEAGLRTLDGPYREVVPFDGRIERPVLTMHTTGDMLVPIHLLQALQRAATASRREHLLVHRIYRAGGHCTFSEPESVTAFDDLVAWVRGGPKPAGDTVMGDLSDAGRRFTNPLRPGDPGTLTMK